MLATDPLWALANSTLGRLMPPHSESARDLLLRAAELVTCSALDTVTLSPASAPLGLVLTGRLVSRYRVIRPGMPFGEEPLLGRELHDTAFHSPHGASFLQWEPEFLEDVLEKQPKAVIALFRRMAARHHTVRQPIWALEDGCGPVAERLKASGHCVLGPGDPGVVHSESLAELEQQHGQIFLDCREGDAPWKELCRSQADARLTLETRSGLLHPQSQSLFPVGTPGLPGSLDAEKEAEWQRLTSLLTGQARGLVLSGGGARGFAHIGVLRALEEHCQSPDSIGGTSMGALVAASWALDRDLDRLTDLARTLGKTSRVLDWAPGATSLTAGFKVARILEELFGARRIEDLTTAYFCVASDLTKAREVVFTTGRLTRAVRASLAIPGVFYPVVRRGDILVDGGLMNNLPLDVLARRLPGGTLFACDVTTGDWLAPAGWVGARRAARGPWWQWTDQLVPRSSGKVPGLANLLLQSLEVNSRRHYRETSHVPHRLLAIDVNGFDPLDFGKWKLLIEEGYRQASTQLASI